MRIKPFYESKTFWGIMMTIVAPTISQLSGVDVTTGIEFIKNIVANGSMNYSFVQWMQIVGQGIGTALTIYGTISPNRKPLKFKDDNE